jgi:hypothetical protein
MDTYLDPTQVCELIPGMTRSHLAQLRFHGTGPSYMRPTPKKIVYRESTVRAWLESTERTQTGDAA